MFHISRDKEEKEEEEEEAGKYLSPWRCRWSVLFFRRWQRAIAGGGVGGRASEYVGTRSEIGIPWKGGSISENGFREKDFSESSAVLLMSHPSPSGTTGGCGRTREKRGEKHEAWKEERLETRIFVLRRLYRRRGEEEEEEKGEEEKKTGRSSAQLYLSYPEAQPRFHDWSYKPGYTIPTIQTPTELFTSFISPLFTLAFRNGGDDLTRGVILELLIAVSSGPDSNTESVVSSTNDTFRSDNNEIRRWKSNDDD